MPRVSTDENKPIEHVTNKNVHKNYNRKARQSIGGNRKKKRRESLGYSRKNRRHTMVGLVPQFTFQKDDSSSDTDVFDLVVMKSCSIIKQLTNRRT